MYGSHSAQLTMIISARPSAEDIFAYVGNAAPPMPEIPASRMRSTISSVEHSDSFFPSGATSGERVPQPSFSITMFWIFRPAGVYTSRNS